MRDYNTLYSHLKNTLQSIAFASGVLFVLAIFMSSNFLLTSIFGGATLLCVVMCYIIEIFKKHLL